MSLLATGVCFSPTSRLFVVARLAGSLARPDCLARAFLIGPNNRWTWYVYAFYYILDYGTGTVLPVPYSELNLP